MHAFGRLRRQAALAAGVVAAGALLAFGGTPALAASLVQIFGSGASLQNQLQNNILIPDAPSPLNTLVAYNSTTSGSAALEFGLTGAGLLVNQDSKASPQLDAFVGVDSPPSNIELNNASTASGLTALDLVTVPVAQSSLGIITSLPVGLLLLMSGPPQLNLDNLLLGQLFAGKLPAAGGYAKNTWGALLLAVGLSPTKSGSATSATLFQDDGGGSNTILIETRKNGAGTTLNLKQYALAVDPTDWNGTNIDQNAYGTNEWPSGASITPSPGNSTDAAEALAVEDNPGQVGYATAGDALAAGFLITPVLLERSGVKFWSFIWRLQDNGTSTSSPIYANPITTSGLASNVYTGSKVGIKGNEAGVGNWNPPGSPWTSSWSGTNASDPNVEVDAGESIDYYPLVAVAYDLSWSEFGATGLSSLYTNPANAGFTAQQFLGFATSTKGQANLNSSSSGYAPLPSGTIQSDAAKAAAGV
jgi:hypothetical protein